MSLTTNESPNNRLPDGLLEFVDGVYVFDSCFRTEVLPDGSYKKLLDEIMNDLHLKFPKSKFLALNFREVEKRSVFAQVLSEHDVTVLEYPQQYESCPLLPLSLIQSFLCESENWLARGNGEDAILLHCERGGWSLLAFILASFQIFRNVVGSEKITLQNMHRNAPKGLLQLLSPLNPVASQLRYLQYVARRNIAPEWPPPERALSLDCLIIRDIPSFDSQQGCRPLIRIYGRNSCTTSGLSTTMLYSMSRKKVPLRHYSEEECDELRIDIQCWVQGDVVLECVHLGLDPEQEVMMFRVMFNTAFIRSNILILNTDDLDIPWGAKDHYPKGFRAELLFGDVDNTSPTPLRSGDDSSGLPTEAFCPPHPPPPPPPPPRLRTKTSSLPQISKTSAPPIPPPPPPRSKTSVPPIPPPPPPVPTPPPPPPPRSKTAAPPTPPPHPPQYKTSAPPTLRSCFPLPLRPPGLGRTPLVVVKPFYWTKMTRVMKGSLWDEIQLHDNQSWVPELDISDIESFFATIAKESSGSSCVRRPERVHLVALRRSHYSEQVLRNIKIPLPDMLGSVLALDSSALDVDQIENLIKVCPTKEEMDILRNYTGDKEMLGKCEQYFMELMKVPRIGEKLRVFAFKTTFASQVEDLKSSLDTVNSATKEVKESAKLRRIMQIILILGNTLNQGTGRGAAVGFKLESLLILSDTRAIKSKMNLMHYLCKLVAEKMPEFLDFSADLGHLEVASKIELKTLAKEMQVVSKGLEKAEQERMASENDGEISVGFRKVLKDFLDSAEAEVRSLISLYSEVGRNADSLSRYFGEDPARCPFEKVTKILTLFMKSFIKSRGENEKQAKFEKKKLEKQKEKIVTKKEGADAPPIPPPPPPRSKTSAPPAPPPPPKRYKLSAPPTPPPHLRSCFPLPLSPARTGRTRLVVVKPFCWYKITEALKGSMWDEIQYHDNQSWVPELDLDVLEIKSHFSTDVTPPPPPGSNTSAPPTPPPPPPQSRTFAPRTPPSPPPSPPPYPPRSKTSAPPTPPLPPPQYKTYAPPTCRPPPPPITCCCLLPLRPPRMGMFMVDMPRAMNCEIMLTKIKFPLPDMVRAVLALDSLALDIDQVENLIKYCPTKEEKEMLRKYTGNKEMLGKCEQFFMELMKVPRIEAKLRVFSFKITFASQVEELKGCLNIINAATKEVKESTKLRQILQTILLLGNALNQGTARGNAVGFRLESLLTLSDTRASNNQMNLIHYLCKLVGEKKPELLDFAKDLVHLEAASKIALKTLAKEMQALSKGLEKVEEELMTSENDGEISVGFRKVLKDFLDSAEAEVRPLIPLYSEVGKNADSLSLYFGEDPARRSFEQVTTILTLFMKTFIKSREENERRAEAEKNKLKIEAMKYKPVKKKDTADSDNQAYLQESLTQNIKQDRAPVKPTLTPKNPDRS